MNIRIKKGMTSLSYNRLYDTLIELQRFLTTLRLINCPPPKKVTTNFLEELQRLCNIKIPKIPQSLYETKNPKERIIFNIKRLLHHPKMYNNPQSTVTSLLELHRIIFQDVHPSWELRPRKQKEQLKDRCDINFANSLKLSNSYSLKFYPTGSATLDTFLFWGHNIMKLPLLHGNLITLFTWLPLQLTKTFKSPTEVSLFFTTILIRKTIQLLNKEKLPLDMLKFLEKLLSNDLYDGKNIYAEEKALKNLQRLSRRQRKIINHLITEPNLSRKELAKRCGVSAVTIFREIKKLEQCGIIKVHRQGKATRYEIMWPVRFYLAYQKDF